MPQGFFPAENDQVYPIVWPCGPDNSIITDHAWFHLAVGGVDNHAEGHVWFLGVDTSRPERQPSWLHDEDFRLQANTVASWPCPDDTALIVVHVHETTVRIGYALELQASP